MIHKYAPERAWRQRLLNGPAMVVEAARNVIKLFVTLVDANTPNYLMMASPLAAVYTLAVGIFREHRSLLARSDFELIKAAMTITKEQFRKHETTTNLDEILFDLEQYTSRLLDGSGTRDTAPDVMESPSTFLGESVMDTVVPGISFSSSLGPSDVDWAGWDWNDLCHLFSNSE